MTLASQPWVTRDRRSFEMADVIPMIGAAVMPCSLFSGPNVHLGNVAVMTWPLSPASPAAMCEPAISVHLSWLSTWNFYMKLALLPALAALIFLICLRNASSSASCL